MQTGVSTHSPERGHYLNLGKLRKVDGWMVSRFAQFLYPYRSWLTVVAFDDGAAIEEVTRQT